MITKLKNKIANLKAFDIDAIILDEVKEIEHIIVEMVSEDQLFEQGITGAGMDISGYAPYSEVTIEIKQQKGQPYNRVTLRDEGDFHSSFYLKIEGNSFFVTASDWKTGDLIEKYGKEIFWLTDENLKEIIQSYLKERAQKEFKKAVA